MAKVVQRKPSFEKEICFTTPENAREEATLVAKYVTLFEQWECLEDECVMVLVPQFKGGRKNRRKRVLKPKLSINPDDIEVGSKFKYATITCEYECVVLKRVR